ncbi:cwf25 [Mucuna pruriens]|uniref:Cwf25 n=1 Tax=Mucuna pruriens TaxID=157652 RepID=A0A371I6J0_MUCPR|nr:cwf25 [Mucuna pruriens]
MALKFLNKKGWHTGSLRNIENVWKAEQKHEAEQKKLEELRKQIQEERERSEFRLLQEKAGLVPRQERLEFLYDSGLSVGKSSNSEGFKALEQFPKSDATNAPSSSASKQEGANAPGALFEEKPQSASDAWRKLHSDPLLMIRQREQEELAKIKNNPVKMAMIRKSVEEMGHKEKAHKKKEKRKKHRSSKSKHIKHSDSEDDITERRKRKSGKGDSDSEDDTTERKKRKSGKGDFDKYRKAQSDSENESSERETRRKKCYEDKKYRERSPSHHQRQRNDKDYKEDAGDRNYNSSKSERYTSEGRSNVDAPRRGDGRFSEASSNRHSGSSLEHGSHYKRRNVAPKLSEEERAAKLKEMQLAAELHEEQRWKRIKKAEDSDAQEAIQNSKAGGRNFLDSAQKSLYGAGEGGSATIAESVRRRTHYSQAKSGGEGNAFRR